MLARVSDAIEELDRSHAALAAVQGDDGRSLAETDGVNPQLCMEWRTTRGRVSDDLTVWGRKFRQRYGASAPTTPADGNVEGSLADAEGADPEGGDGYDAHYEQWDNDVQEGDANVA